MQPKLAVSQVYKVFGDAAPAALDLLRRGRSKQEILAETGATVGVRDASFDVQEGEIFVVMGLSGSGKSTLVRMLNGLIPPTSGQILIDGEDIARADAARLRRIRREKISMIFQHFALFPHWTVAENVAYGLKITGVPHDERRARALDVLEQVGLAAWADSLPSDLSGGMQQRVGLARGLAAEPDILLMDEPFGALDPLIRREMQMELLTLQRTLKKTIVFITHDLNEALMLGSRIAIMKDGQIVQIGTAQEIVTAPADDYVAAFVADIDRGRVFTADDVSSDATTIQLRQTSVRDALRMMERGGANALYVLDGDRVAGVVTYRDLAASEMDTAITASLQGSLITDFPTADTTTCLSDLYSDAGSGLPIAVTDERDRLLAVVEPADVLAHLSGDATPQEQQEQTYAQPR
ncbi:betaine/proline/choline family ABC transporter ATP-binding protein [Paracoccus sp. S-4012]|uniref:quaternary amine ABC transporter ATP-binding protein n=1 Tax=Paracoccus sp. S-4012 TaxID=2665648 RepID=UPI0012B15422|nr:glycine betaine/L-proline ABC transporter ATP-binding protein [Paracoccus sp. S-4012]MRX50036.1 betaine/proline/choline family ABC transporter ATP-binding protein [Paracoccus sp. S-4012]